MKNKFVYPLLAITAALVLTGCEEVRVEKFPSGAVRFETTYVKDKKQGVDKEYYESGILKRETNYEAEIGRAHV